MDIDRILTPDERVRYRKEGRCFECHQTGHRANDHDDPSKGLQPRKKTANTQKPAAKQAPRIRALEEEPAKAAEEEPSGEDEEGKDSDF